MVVVHNTTPTSITIVDGGKSVSISSGGYLEIPCEEDVGCAKWSIFRGGNKYWEGKVPCKTNSSLEIGDGVSFDETRLPSTTERGGIWLYLALGVLLLIVLLLLYKYY